MMLNSWLLTQNCWNNLLPNFLVPLHSKFPFSWTFCLRPWENAFKKVFPGNEASTDSTNVIWQHQVSRKSAALIFQKARTNPSLPLTWSRSKTQTRTMQNTQFSRHQAKLWGIQLPAQHNWDIPPSYIKGHHCMCVLCNGNSPRMGNP